VIPGPAALCEGTVVHARHETADHQFRYPVSQVWLDPDRPDELCRHHWAWSASRPAPVRFRASDYGDAASSMSLGVQARAEVSALLGRDLSGPVRMITQLRRWGWLFNPITIFLVWDDPSVSPVAAVLEVTNTPWKERHRYPIELAADNGRLTSVFDKELHVSPFLGMKYRYVFSVLDRDDRVAVDIDVIDPDGTIAVHTALRTHRSPASHDALAASLRSTPLPTHRVSAGIHAHAARLWRKGVPFVPPATTSSPQAPA